MQTGEAKMPAKNTTKKTAKKAAKTAAGKSTGKPTKKTESNAPSFETIPNGTDVTWHYRSAIGHGTVVGIHKLGATADKTMYAIEQHDHHPGEPKILHHSGKALTRARKS